MDMSDLKCRKFTGPDCNVTGVKVYEDQLYVCYNGYCAKRFDLSVSLPSQRRKAGRKVYVKQVE